MVRPDEIVPVPPSESWWAVSSCVGLAGESPVAVSAGAPRSRPRVLGEILAPERGVESPRAAVLLPGGEPSCGPQCESVNLAAS